MLLNFEPETLNFRASPLVGYPCKGAADLGKFARQLDPLAAVGAGEELTIHNDCMLESGRDRRDGSRSTPCECSARWAAAVFPKCDRRPQSAVSSRGRRARRRRSPRASLSYRLV